MTVICRIPSIALIGAGLVLGSLSLGPTTTAHAAGTPEQRRACRGDAMRLCREFVPNVSRITSCMERNVRKLSPACRAHFK